MVAVLLIAGIGLLLAGLMAIAFGIPVKEFSFGNTLILTGAVGACTGIVMLGLWMVVRELKNIARRLGSAYPAELDAGTGLSPAATGAALEDQAPESGGFSLSRDRPTAENGGSAESPGHPASPPPWHEETSSRDRGRIDAPATPEPVEAAPVVKPRRNLLFSSSSRKERERAEARPTEPSAPDLRPPAAAAPPAPEPSEVPPATFDDAWPKSERSPPPQRRGGRVPSTFAETAASTPAADRPPSGARNEDRPPVTVLKAGVVDGMAYSLYSDGSIEAQMPEGMMRFASIDELRAHLDHRS
jgi:hypothetical protein